MTGAEIVAKFESMVDDDLGSTFVYQLLNDAKDEVEAMNAWEILKDEQAYTVSSGYSYSSALGSLPDDFAMDIRMVEDSSNIDLAKVSFDDRYGKVNHPFGYFLDLANDNIHLSGSNHSAKTVYLYYIKTSTDLTSSDTWSFPSRFHSVLPLKMAELYYLSDAGEKARSYNQEWAIQFERKLLQMYQWNDSIKINNRRSRTSNWENPKGLNV